MKTTRRVLALLLFLCFLTATATGQQAAPAPPAPADNAEFLRTADEIMAEMSRILGLPAKESLRKSIRSREQIREYLISQFRSQKDAAKRYADQKTLEKFGLLPRGFELEKFLVALLTEQIAGLYDPKSNEFFIADWLGMTEQKLVMAHELVHALHDQHYQIESWLNAAKPNDDALLARDAVLEGSAIAAMFDYVFASMGQSRDVRSLPDVGKLIRLQMAAEFKSNPMFASAPLYIREALLFPYVHGASFTQRVLKGGAGWAELGRVFRDPPVSTQQVLHPELYQEGSTPAPVTLPPLLPLLPRGWKELDQNILGEFGLSLVLWELLGEENARQLAPAWAGDRYALLENPQSGRLLLVFRLRLDTHESAGRFLGQYGDALEKKYKQRSSVLRRPGFFSFETEEGGAFLRCARDECLSVEGAGRATFDRIARAAGFPSAPVGRPARPATSRRASRASHPPLTVFAAAPAGARP